MHEALGSIPSTAKKILFYPGNLVKQWISAKK
jgi:hypothetical protein